MSEHAAPGPTVRRPRRGRPATRARALGRSQRSRWRHDRLVELVVGARRSRLVRRQLRSRGLAVVAAAVVAIAVVHRVDAAERAAARWGATESVVVATRDLAAGELLARDDSVLATWPATLAPPDALHEAPIGRRLSEGIRAGQPLVGGQLAPSGRGAWAAALESGESAVQVPLVQAMPGLEVHDVVDVVMATAGTTEPGRRVLAHDARVLQVEDTVVTVAVADGEAATTAASVLVGATALVVRG